MATITKIEDATSVSASGGTETTDTVALADSQNDLLLLVEGDANSNNLDIETEIQYEDSGTWVLHKRRDSEDLTESQNNAKSYKEDIQFAQKVRWVITNDGGSQTTLTVKVREE